MRMTIESTDRLVTVDGLPGRVWEGTTEAGVAVYVLVTRIAVPIDADHGQFERELAEQRPPSREAVAAFPVRMVL